MRLNCTSLMMTLLFAPAAAAQDAANDWAAEKCAAYEAAWNQALDAFGDDEMNYAFLAGNENFIASDCMERGEICPQSSQELEIANALTLALMNAGTASTFLPFKCPVPESAADGWSGPGL